ncbi:putative baseplate assembly protein [Glutamicibacter sp. MNS18]|uniref:putative baseplate assembly protein n=1 Tax=Glutamicibacter sp. MNS18 TaxID=2989817 RepID=UPI0022358EF2|nr:putative baseplate assembly protein [Glutamicibacter sp. MNS18]MCW4464557.1 putative baseplate assembly protein [Glutamicibacter sp. MNS18]
MTLPDPPLDTRSFADLVAEARARIPRYTPEWTNLNDSDPGMTLVKLHAWMTETILHELNRVPELNYLKFLKLLGVHLRPASPARAEVCFTPAKLDNPDDPLVVPVPAGAQLAVDDPDLPVEVLFETNRTLMALNARIAALFVPSGQPEHPHVMVTRYTEDLSWLPGFRAVDPQQPTPLYLGLLLRPLLAGGQQSADYALDRLPAGPLDLYVNAVAANDPDPADPLTLPERATHTCPRPGTDITAGHLRWQVYTGGIPAAAEFGDPDSHNWQDVALSHDDSGDFARSGHLVLEVPAGATSLNPALLPEEFWDSMGATRPPGDLGGLLDILSEPGVLQGLADKWQRLGVADAEDTLALAACGQTPTDVEDKLTALPPNTVDPTVLTHAEWVALSESFEVPLPLHDGKLRDLYWFRALPVRPWTLVDAPPVPLAGLHLNTVPATQAVTRLDDNLGRTTGRPGQQLVLPRTPVLVDARTGTPELELELASGTERLSWRIQPDFTLSGPEDRHAVLDAATGTITFGDGERGLVPEAGLQVIATRWRTGGGALGNVPAETISKIKGRIRNIQAAGNLRASRGGAPGETLEQLIHRAPQLLRIGGLANTAEDFADLALRTPGQNFHSAYTLARRVPGRPPADPPGSFVEKDGAITVVVLPDSPEPAPQPDAEALRALCAWLEPHRLVTTELHFTGPSYTPVTRLSVRVGIRPGHEQARVIEDLYTALLDFLHPLRGGPAGTGWPFGYDILYSDLFDVMLAVPGIHRARELVVELADTTPVLPDVLPLAAGHLPLLGRSAIEVVSGYE